MGVLNSWMSQSALMRPLLIMKNENGEMAARIHNVGMSFTENQNIVNIPRITRMFNYKEEI